MVKCHSKMYVVLLAMVVVCGAVYWASQRRRALAAQLKTDLPTVPILGHLLLFNGGNEDLMRTIELFARDSLKQGGISKAWMGHLLFAVVTDPLDAEFLLKHCLSKNEIYNSFKIAIDNGSIIAPVPIWRPRRKLMATLFSIKTLNSLMPMFNRQSTALTEQLRNVPERTDFSVWEYFTAYTMNSICEATLDTQVCSQLKSNKEFLSAFDELTEAAALKVLNPWYYFDTILKLTPYYRRMVRKSKYVADFVSKIIETKRNDIRKNNHSVSENHSNQLCFLEHLLLAEEEGNGFTDLELLEELVVLLLAATDTSALTTAYTALLLAQHQDVQDKVYTELQEVFGDSNRPVEVEDIHKLKYLEAVIKESLRLYPPVPIIAREVENDIKIPSGLTLPKGCGVVVYIWGLHRHPSYWGRDAEQFRPERFLEGWPTHAAAFMGFSYGPRGCLGPLYAMLSLKTTLATLLRRCRLLPAAGGTTEPLRTSYNLMMRHVDNYVLQIEPRRLKTN